MNGSSAKNMRKFILRLHSNLSGYRLSIYNKQKSLYQSRFREPVTADHNEHTDGSGERPLLFLPGDLADCPGSRDRCLNKHLQPHNEEHEHLLDVVRGTGDQACGRNVSDLLQ